MFQASGVGFQCLLIIRRRSVFNVNFDYHVPKFFLTLGIFLTPPFRSKTIAVILAIR